MATIQFFFFLPAWVPDLLHRYIVHDRELCCRDVENGGSDSTIGGMLRPSSTGNVQSARPRCLADSMRGMGF